MMNLKIFKSCCFKFLCASIVNLISVGFSIFLFLELLDYKEHENIKNFRINIVFFVLFFSSIFCYFLSIYNKNKNFKYYLINLFLIIFFLFLVPFLYFCFIYFLFANSSSFIMETILFLAIILFIILILYFIYLNNKKEYLLILLNLLCFSYNGVLFLLIFFNLLRLAN